MAWFSATIGLSVMRARTVYSARICGQSVASVLGASSCTAAMAACSWYGPTAPFGSVAPRSATPSSISARSHMRSILLVQRDQLAVGAAAGVAARVRQQHQREQPGHLGFVGQQPVKQAPQAQRLGGQIAALQLVRRRWRRTPR